MANTVHYTCLTTIQSILQALTFAGIWDDGDSDGTEPLPSSQIVLAKLPTDRVLPKDATGKSLLPGIVVSLVPVPELKDGGTNAQDDVGWPCMVTIINANNQNLTVVEAELHWRQQIRQTFENKRPASLITALQGFTTPVALKICKWEPAPVIDLALFKDANLFVSSAVIRPITRELRPADPVT